MESYKVFEEKFYHLIKDGVSTIQIDKEDEEAIEPIITIPQSNTTVLSCSYCKTKFTNSLQQREHYKLDWHRYNLKQNLLSKPSVTEEEFVERTDDVSSISGSDTEEEETLDMLAGAQGKIFLKNANGKVVGLYKCLVGNKKEDVSNDSAFKSLMEYHKNSQWAVFMLGGGHFAGAIFKDGEPFLHKTFHCYTVRAGQGGAQSTRDNQGGTSKSAGSSLRRYNELSLIQHVGDIMESWKSEIDRCSLIICRAAGPYNKSVFFGGKTPLLNRNDARIRNVPFSTRRPTFTEAKRVYGILSTVFLYDSVDIATKSFASPERSRRTRSKTINVNRAKSRETVERNLPAEENESTAKEVEIRNTLVKSKRNCSSKRPEKDEENDNSNEELMVEDETVDFNESLRAFEDTLTPEERHVKKSSRTRQKARKKEKKLIQKRRDDIFESAKNGDVEKLNELLVEERTENPMKAIDDICTDSGDSLLHIAAKNCRENIIVYLLENNCNLCNRNDKQETPYTCTKDKNIREFFKKYAADHPEKFNYNKANIPTNKSTPEELAEKKLQQRKIKKDKEKVKKKEQFIKKQEQNEKNRFLELSDREKRALAAERRILNNAGVVISRCFLCASDMSGKVPFEYLGNRFCTIDCLKAHRMKQPVILSTE